MRAIDHLMSVARKLDVDHVEQIGLACSVQSEAGLIKQDHQFLKRLAIGGEEGEEREEPHEPARALIEVERHAVTSVLDAYMQPGRQFFAFRRMLKVRIEGHPQLPVLLPVFESL